MSIAMWFEENGSQMGKTYISDGVLKICRELERKGALPVGADKLQFMDGKKGIEVAPILGKAIACLSNDGVYPEDIFVASEGNAKTILSLLRDEALKHPQSIVVAWR